jgi:hypothetical protein
VVPRFVFAACLLVLSLATGALAAGNPRHEQERLNAADTGRAKAMLVRQSDLGPGWRGTAVPKDDSDLSCPGFNPDLSMFTITGKADAAFGHSTGASVVAFAEIYTTRAQAAGDFRKAAKPAIARCLRWAFEREAKAKPEPGLSLRVLSSQMLASPRLGERSASYRMVVRASGNGRTFRMYMDVLVFQKGRAIGALMATTAFEPLPGRRALASRMLARMS